MGDSHLSPPAGQRLSVPARRGLVVASASPDRRPDERLAISNYLPFFITLLAGGIVVAIVALALGGTPRGGSRAIPLPPPSVSATPAASVGATGQRTASGH